MPVNSVNLKPDIVAFEFCLGTFLPMSARASAHPLPFKFV